MSTTDNGSCRAVQIAATTTAQHATAVNVIPPQPVMRIASTDVAAAAIAATSTLWTPAPSATWQIETVTVRVYPVS
ncbi:hypothetical protein ACNJQJ_22005, partial [Mycobacterium tuberculosis]